MKRQFQYHLFVQEINEMQIPLEFYEPAKTRSLCPNSIASMQSKQMFVEPEERIEPHVPDTACD